MEASFKILVQYFAPTRFVGSRVCCCSALAGWPIFSRCLTYHLHTRLYISTESCIYNWFGSVKFDSRPVSNPFILSYRPGRSFLCQLRVSCRAGQSRRLGLSVSINPIPNQSTTTKTSTELSPHYIGGIESNHRRVCILILFFFTSSLRHQFSLCHRTVRCAFKSIIYRTQSSGGF